MADKNSQAYDHWDGAFLVTKQSEQPWRLNNVPKHSSVTPPESPADFSVQSWKTLRFPGYYLSPE